MHLQEGFDVVMGITRVGCVQMELASLVKLGVAITEKKHHMLCMKTQWL